MKAKEVKDHLFDNDKTNNQLTGESHLQASSLFKGKV